MVSKEQLMAFIIIAAVVTALIAGPLLVMSCAQEHTQPKWNGFTQCYGDEDCKKLKDGKHMSCQYNEHHWICMYR